MGESWWPLENQPQLLIPLTNRMKGCPMGHLMPSSESQSSRRSEVIRHHTQHRPDTWTRFGAVCRTGGTCQFTSPSLDNNGNDCGALVTQGHQQPLINNDATAVPSKGRGRRRGPSWLLHFQAHGTVCTGFTWWKLRYTSYLG